MRSIITIAAGLALALAPVAHAQVTCSEMIRVTDYSKDDFDDILGEEIDDEFYEATYTLAGATECTLDFGWDSVYACLWVYDSYSAAYSAYGSQRAAVASCLPGWSTDAMTPAAFATDGYRTLEGTFYNGAGVNADYEWGVYVEEHTSSNGTDWHVSVGLAYLW